MQFIFDCPVIPRIIKKTQESLEPIRKELFYVTKTYVFKIFCDKNKTSGNQVNFMANNSLP